MWHAHRLVDPPCPKKPRNNFTLNAVFFSVIDSGSSAFKTALFTDHFL
jgi:hypothetical protein